MNSDSPSASGPETSSHNLGRQNFGDPANKGKHPSLGEARDLMTEWVTNPRLRLHMFQVSALMEAWARDRLGLKGKEAEMWAVAGLLHDADWDQWPDEHCRRIIAHLEPSCDPEILHAIASHSPAFFGVEPVSPMDHMLYAFDELSGFVHAVSLVRPEGYAGMKPSSVKKKLKEKSFAAQVNRSDIEDALSRIDQDLDELLGFIIPVQAEVTARDDH